jgi:hypothetical protein
LIISSTFLPFLRLLLRYYITSARLIKVVTSPEKEATVPMPPNDPVITVKAEDPSYETSLVIVINHRTDIIVKNPYAYRARTSVEGIVIIFCQSIDTKYPLPSGLFLSFFNRNRSGDFSFRTLRHGYSGLHLHDLFLDTSQYTS